MPMIYFTFYKKPTFHQVTFQDLLDKFYQGELPDPQFIQNNPKYRRTITLELPETTQLPLEKYQIPKMIKALEELLPDISSLQNIPRQQLYHSFSIPKRTGGLRHIDAPVPELMELLRKMKGIFENNLRVLSHDAAFAYVKQRSCKDALIRHQQAQSKWFLKLDIKDFFPSCTTEFIHKQLSKIFPFSEIYKDPLVQLNSLMENIIDICLLNGSLPQGSPMSPLLTNLLMIPLDYKIQHFLWKANGKKFVYTRYADDILISSPYDFDWRTVQTDVQVILENNSPFKLKTEKTRYGSSAGRNWNLGLMLNKDNQITIGHKKKERLKATVHNFLADFTSGTVWSKLDVQVMLGNLSYCYNIEPEYVQQLIQKYSEKFHCNFEQETKRIIKTQP
jgi:hypothetical protein